jgi:N-acetylglucosamine kinase-like BadF-type ATPase
MNCLGAGPTGRVVRFAALGPLSGDLAAGGEWVGLAALGAAVRARDGRGPRTVLERAVPEHFGMSRPEAVSRAMYLGRLPQNRLVELPPAVFRAAGSGDRVARGILDQVADEVVTMVSATITRLHVARREVDVVLGGGMFRANDDVFLDRIRSRIEATAPRAEVTTLRVPPVTGAALIGLQEIGAGRNAETRLREEVGRWAAALERPTARQSTHRGEPIGSREA